MSAWIVEEVTQAQDLLRTGVIDSQDFDSSCAAVLDRVLCNPFSTVAEKTDALKAVHTCKCVSKAVIQQAGKRLMHLRLDAVQPAALTATGKSLSRSSCQQ